MTNYINIALFSLLFIIYKSENESVFVWNKRDTLKQAEQTKKKVMSSLHRQVRSTIEKYEIQPAPKTTIIHA